MNVPKLRFNIFSGEWSEVPITNCLDLMTDYVANGSFESLKKNVSVFIDNDYAFYVRLYDLRLGLGHSKQTYVNEKSYNFLKKSSLESGDILIANIGANVGEVWKTPLLDRPATIAPNMIVLKVKSSTNGSYLYHYLKTELGEKEIKSTVSGSGQPKVNKTELKRVKVKLPPTKEEQTKIADFITTIDEKITQLTQKSELLTQYKKIVMQKIFSQELRFKDNDGREFPEWDFVELEKIAAKVNKKNKDTNISNVLTNSAIQGIVSQSDYFDRDIANQNNLGGYYIVETDDFVYNPRISANALVGPIKRNHLTVGVMSPLYTVFRFTKGNLDFYEQYFQTNHWHDYMKSISNTGARHDRMNITNENFFDLPLPCPVEKEQLKIANFFIAIDDKITQTQAVVATMKQYKQGLLQQMFV